jgi:hypothetical protein
MEPKDRPQNTNQLSNSHFRSYGYFLRDKDGGIWGSIYCLPQSRDIEERDEIFPAELLGCFRDGNRQSKERVDDVHTAVAERYVLQPSSPAVPLAIRRNSPPASTKFPPQRRHKSVLLRL